MAAIHLFTLFLSLQVFLLDALSMDYYAITCPFVEIIVRNTVNNALQRDSTLAAGLLRMHFHDCFVQGCDASVLIDSTADNRAEKDSGPNFSLRGFQVIDRAKEEVEKQCPGVVSCADIIAMAARDSILWAGGPIYEIPKGRKDGRRSKAEEAFFGLPPPFFNSSDLIRVFAKHGLLQRDMVVLSGAHTLGAASCRQFKNRLRNFGARSNVDPVINPHFAALLSRTCASGDGTQQPLDWSPALFDNAYYNALQMHKGVLTSDQSLFESPETRGLVNAYAMNQALFFFDFTQAIIKMGMIEVKEGREGEVRTNCRRIN